MTTKHVYILAIGTIAIVMSLIGISHMGFDTTMPASTKIMQVDSFEMVANHEITPEPDGTVVIMSEPTEQTRNKDNTRELQTSYTTNIFYYDQKDSLYFGEESSEFMWSPSSFYYNGNQMDVDKVEYAESDGWQLWEFWILDDDMNKTDLAAKIRMSRPVDAPMSLTVTMYGIRKKNDILTCSTDRRECESLYDYWDS